MHRVEDNPLEPVAFTGIDVAMTVTEEVRRLSIVDVRTSVGGGRFRAARKVRVRPGQRLSVRVTLEPYDGTRNVVEELTVRVPRDARRRGFLEIAGGEPCSHRCPSRRAETLAGFIRAEERGARNDELYASLHLGRGRAPDAQARVRLAHVVARRELVEVVVRRGGRGGGAATEG